MNRRQSMALTRLAAFSLLCLMLWSGFPGLQGLSEGAVMPPQPEAAGHQLVLALFRNNALEQQDPQASILVQAQYAVNLLHKLPVRLSVLPLMANNPPFAQDVLLPSGREILDQAFSGLFRKSKPLESKVMDNAISDSLGIAHALVSNDVPSTVVVLQAQKIQSADHVQWQRIRDLLMRPTVQLRLISLAGEGTADLLSMAQGLNLSTPDQLSALAQHPAGEWAELSPRVKAVLIPPGHPDIAYRVWLDCLLEDARIAPQMPLAVGAQHSTVLLPPAGISQVVLALEGVQPGHVLHVQNAQGQPLPWGVLATDDAGKQVLTLPFVGGELQVFQTPGSAGLEQVEETQENTQLPTGQDQEPGTGVSTPEDGQQPLVKKPVEGFVVFPFSLSGSISLTPLPEDQPLSKHQALDFPLDIEKEPLKQLLSNYPAARAELVVTPPGEEADVVAFQYQQQENRWQAQYTPAVSGIFQVQAQLAVGDFYTLKSPPLTFEVINRAPEGKDQKHEVWANQEAGEESMIPLPLQGMFEDPDEDPLSYLVATEETLLFAPEAEVQNLGRLVVAEGVLQFTPLSPQGQLTLQVQATDVEGLSAVADLDIVWRSEYEALASIRLAEPKVSPEDYGKNSLLDFSIRLDVPADDGEERIKKLFLEKARLTVVFQEEGETAVELPMEYDEGTAAYTAQHRLPGRGFHAQWHAKAVLEAQSGMLEPITISSDPLFLQVDNKPPQWLEGKQDLGGFLMRAESLGREEVLLTIDMNQHFKDDDNQVEGDSQDITYTLQVRDSDNRLRPLQHQEGQAYAVLPAGQPEGEVLAAIVLEKSSQADLVFREKGRYTLEIQAVDADQGLAEGKLQLEVSSHRERLLIRIGLIGLSALVLLVAALVVYWLMRPSYQDRVLQASVEGPSLKPMVRQIPLSAWHKQRIPLAWVMLYACVPLEEDALAALQQFQLKPHKKGVKLIQKQHIFRDAQHQKLLGKRFVVKPGDQGAEGRAGDVFIKLSLVQGRTLAEGQKGVLS